MKDFNQTKQDRLSYLENKRDVIQRLGNALVDYLTLEIGEEIKQIKEDKIDIEELVCAQEKLQMMETSLKGMKEDIENCPTHLKPMAYNSIQSLEHAIKHQEEQVSWLQKGIEEQG